MLADCDGSEVVVRFSPFSPEKLQVNAEDTYALEAERGRIPARYGVSVLASPCEPGEAISDVIHRICTETTLTGRTIAVSTGQKLRAAGFDLVKDSNEKELHHHLVGEAPFESVPQVDVLASILNNERMRNPSWTKGEAA